MIWNPAEQGADDFIDIPLADWKNFLCVEPVIVSKPLQLLPQASFTGKLTITNLLNSANLQP
jgi:D-hexose-6-phosphate mutarotase